jgi:hemerythrin
MPLFEWSDDLSVGIEEFDSHHKRLVQLINQLNDTIADRNDAAVVEGVLTELTNYTMYHFFAEEDAMQKCGYPDYRLHREEHMALTEKTLGFVQDWHRGERGFSRELLAFLTEWLKHHILVTDKCYTPFLNAEGVFEVPLV